jgi:hypothetical protein
MTPNQKKTVARMYVECMRQGSLLRQKLELDLLTGSVSMGGVTRNNPPVPEQDLPDAMQSVFIFLMKMPYPWDWDKNIDDERTVEIMALKQATLRFLSDRRIRANRRVMEAAIDHFRMVEGNAIISVSNRGGVEEFSEYQDAFFESQRLTTDSTILVLPDDDHKTFTDYRKITTLRAKCCPSAPHYAKGWCEPHYRSFARRGKSVYPDFSPELIPVHRSIGAEWKTKKNGLRVAETWTTASSRSAWLELLLLPYGQQSPYDDPITWCNERVREYFRTQRQTLPTSGNCYKHAEVIRRLNKLHREGKIDQYTSQILAYNNQLAKARAANC